MTTSTDYKMPAPSMNDLTQFLSKYSSRLLGAGATCIRLEKNVERIAHTYGKEIELTIMPRHVHISVWEEGHAGIVTSISSVKHNVISFNINTRLSELSWEIADGKTDFNTAVRRFDEIVNSDRQSKWLVLILAALANASFCRLFGGDFMAMATVFVATAVGYYMKLLLLARGTDVRIMFIACSFISTVLGSTGILFSFGSTPAIAMGTSVLYLVPGIPFLNSFSDMLYRHYLCAFSRFADAMVLTCCMSVGLCAGMLMMNAGMF